ncbi:DUF550 domain-containing protein [Salmonella enterica subsp. enterica]|nr:DUF550 domain-containing protein [Salmonella enterica subsp. enterica]
MTTITNSKLTDERVSNATLIRLIQWADQHNSHYVAAALCELQERRKADNQEPASERKRIRREHAEWSDATFGNVGPVGPLKHLSKEALETAAEPGDLSEWADMQFLLWDAQRRAGITDKQITLAMVEKLAINKTRQWPEPKDGEPRLHIKEQSAPVTPDSWISCSERMPDDGQHVIILCDGAFVLYAQYRDGEFFDVVRNGEEFFETHSRNVTDWMPLPEPPQEEK